MPRIRKRKENVIFDETLDYRDIVAESTIPTDFKEDVDAVWILGDGNCLPRALSHAYIGDDTMHKEIRARIVVEGIRNQKKYCSEETLMRGSFYIPDREPLPKLFAKYSDSYTSGQKITLNTIDYIYMEEMHDCSKIGEYMGLWQLAQAASILDAPIQSVYPDCGDPIMRTDFNRFFFPVNSTPRKRT